MRLRLILATPDGQPLGAIDSAHADGHAQRWAEQNVALLAKQGIEAMVVEFDPVGGYDDTVADLTALSDVGIEVRSIPGGGREIIGIHRRVGDRKASARAISRALRVLYAPPDISNARARLRPQRGPR